MSSATVPRHPVYIGTKGRPTRQLTARFLLKIGITPTLVVEDAEHDAYAAANPDCNIVVWPSRYYDEYEKTPELDPHPTTGICRNYAWDHSMEQGATHHWIMDDNIRGFYVLDHGTLYVCTSGRFLGWHEEFADRWENLGAICLSQDAFIIKPVKRLVVNTRMYCCTLIDNRMQESGIRWRRGYNEDTITSLDILKTRYWCTVQSYVAAIKKVGTSRKVRLEGGMSQFYANGGFIRKANELVRVHPDCCKVTERFDRVHHSCHYRQFTHQLIHRDGMPHTAPAPPAP